MTRLKTDSRVTLHQPTQALSIASGGGEIIVVETAFYSEPEKIAQASTAGTRIHGPSKSHHRRKDVGRSS